MEKKIIYRDRQELQSADLNNSQEFTQEGLDHVVSDAISPDRHYSGFQVSQASTTEVSVAPGRLYQGGERYARDEAAVLSLFQYLPLVTKICVAVVLWGQETDDTVEARDFLVDLGTGTTEPQAVAMQRKRICNVNLLPGVEAADPQPPSLQSGTLGVAYVYMTTAGIDRIEQLTANRLPQLADISQRTSLVESWKTLAQPRISTLQSDVAALANLLHNLPGMDVIRALSVDVARLKETTGLPDDYAAWACDHFLDGDESDVEDPEYLARSEEGIRFPWAGQTEQQMTLFNPYTTDVKNFSGFILPAHTEVVRLQTSGYSGDLSISQYQYQTFESKLGEMSWERIRYGGTQLVCTNHRFWLEGKYDPVTNVFERNGQQYLALNPEEAFKPHGWVRIQAFWKDIWADSYWYLDDTDHTVNGSQIAQTFLNSQNGWVTSLGLFFTDIAESGVVYIWLTETERGVPNLDRVLNTVSVDVADLRKYPLETKITIPPTYLEAGKRYALVVITGGDHHLATVSGTEYTQGTLFYSMDGEYYQGDFTKDLMLKFYYAQFSNPRTVVELNPVSLSGGITDLDLLYSCEVPPACEMLFDYQVGGQWIPVARGTAQYLSGMPPMLPLRAVFIGSTDVMPGLWLTGSRIRATRPGTVFRHVSTERTLASPTEQVEVQILLEGFDDTKHTAAVTLRAGGGTVNPTSVEDEERPSGLLRKSYFTISSPGVDTYAIVVDGTSTTAQALFHVAERVDLAF